MCTLTSIRPVRLEDAAGMAALNRRLSEETKFMLLTPEEASGLEEEQSRILVRVLESTDEHLLVATHDQALIGFAAAYRRPFSRIRHCFSLVLGVQKACWGRYVGHDLLAQIESWASHNGGRRLELTVLSSNERAIRLYRHCGFDIEGTRRASICIDGDPEDELMMAKLI